MTIIWYRVTVWKWDNPWDLIHAGKLLEHLSAYKKFKENPAPLITKANFLEEFCVQVEKDNKIFRHKALWQSVCRFRCGKWSKIQRPMYVGGRKGMCQVCTKLINFKNFFAYIIRDWGHNSSLTDLINNCGSNILLLYLKRVVQISFQTANEHISKCSKCLCCEFGQVLPDQRWKSNCSPRLW
jgi:hypothetical protein